MLVIIELQGVRQVALVYANGHFVDKSENGFIPFGFQPSSSFEKNRASLREKRRINQGLHS